MAKETAKDGEKTARRKVTFAEDTNAPVSTTEPVTSTAARTRPLTLSLSQDDLDEALSESQEGQQKIREKISSLDSEPQEGQQKIIEKISSLDTDLISLESNIFNIKSTDQLTEPQQNIESMVRNNWINKKPDLLKLVARYESLRNKNEYEDLPEKTKYQLKNVGERLEILNQGDISKLIKYREEKNRIDGTPTRFLEMGGNRQHKVKGREKQVPQLLGEVGDLVERSKRSTKTLHFTERLKLFLEQITQFFQKVLGSPPKPRGPR